MNALPGPAPAPILPAAELQPLLGWMLPALLQRRGEALSVKDPAGGRYVHVNEAMAALLDRAPAEVAGCSDAELLDAAQAAALRAAEQRAAAQDGPLTSEHRLERAGERRDHAVWRVLGPPDAAGRRWLCAVWTDVTAERAREAQLRAALEQIEQQQQALEALRRDLADQALRDPDSGLHGRAHFDDQLHREVDLSQREHREFALVLIEIDPPRAEVKTLGEAGRRCLVEAMGRLLRSGTRAMDASCRFDEGRYAVLLSGVGLATAHNRMEGLRRKCAAQLVVHGGRELRFTVAVGVASFPHTAHTREGLLQACEAALAEARRRGGNLVTLAAIRFEDG